jgi:hypothetical protein
MKGSNSILDPPRGKRSRTVVPTTSAGSMKVAHVEQVVSEMVPNPLPARMTPSMSRLAQLQSFRMLVKGIIGYHKLRLWSAMRFQFPSGLPPRPSGTRRVGFSKPNWLPTRYLSRVKRSTIIRGLLIPSKSNVSTVSIRPPATTVDCSQSNPCSP